MVDAQHGNARSQSLVSNLRPDLSFPGIGDSRGIAVPAKKDHLVRLNRFGNEQLLLFSQGDSLTLWLVRLFWPGPVEEKGDLSEQL